MNATEITLTFLTMWAGLGGVFAAAAVLTGTWTNDMYRSCYSRFRQRNRSVNSAIGSAPEAHPHAS